MSIGVRKIILIFCAFALIGCAGGKPSRWGHFHGDFSNRGFQHIDSGFALSSSWISNPYRITSSSPVIGTDFQGREVIYVGTTNAKLIAIKSKDGTEKWQRVLGAAGSRSSIVSSASVSDKGDVYIIANRVSADGRNQSTLHKVDQFGKPVWSYSFPDNGYTTGSPKVVSSPAGILVFVYVNVGMVDDVRGELYVLQDKGMRHELLDHKTLGDCRFEGNDRTGIDEIIGNMDAVRDTISSFPIKFGETDIGLTDNFIDPTVAVYPVENKTLIATADNLCSIGVFEWTGDELAVLWRQEHDFARHSSATVLDSGLMVIGRHDGSVLAYDVLTGVKMWEYDAGQPVFATPAASPDQFIFVVSRDHLLAIDSTDGTPIQAENRSAILPLIGATYSSPAITANRVYVSTREMLTTTYDFKTRASDTNFHGNGLSSPAIGRDGAVYSVTAGGTIRKYAGTE